MKFLAMKMNDEAEKLPVTFGPRQVEFVRIKEKKKREEDAEECLDEGRIFAFWYFTYLLLIHQFFDSLNLN